MSLDSLIAQAAELIKGEIGDDDVADAIIGAGLECDNKWRSSGRWSCKAEIVDGHLLVRVKRDGVSWRVYEGVI